MSFSAAMTDITIICVIHHETADRAFPVRIAEKLLIGDLKESIKEKRPDIFANVPAALLVLWKVNIPINNANAVLKDLVLENNEEKGVQELLPVKKIGKIFPDEPAEEHIHIVVAPPASKAIHCKAT